MELGKQGIMHIYADTSKFTLKTDNIAVSWRPKNLYNINKIAKATKLNKDGKLYDAVYGGKEDDILLLTNGCCHENPSISLKEYIYNVEKATETCCVCHKKFVRYTSVICNGKEHIGRYVWVGSARYRREYEPCPKCMKKIIGVLGGNNE
jgi:hypothetical protein